MIISLEVPIPDSGYDPAGEIHAASYLADRLEAVRRDYMETFLPDAPDSTPFRL